MGRPLLAGLIIVGITAALFEGVCALAVETGLLVSARPSYGRDAYWWGDHPDFGVWRHPDGRYEHVSACFQVSYRSNGAGARDAERPLKSDQPRVVVLGDSFLDGWGLGRAERLSNRLEGATGLAHLNFAMPHFGPYQEALVYRELASRYDHDAVLVGLLPANDFVDSDLELAGRLVDYEYRYRPYLVEASVQSAAADGAPAGYVRFDLREPGWRRFLRSHSYAFNALLRARVVWSARGPAEPVDPMGPIDPAGPASPAGPAEAPPPVHSWFYDFGPSDLRRLEAILDAVVHEAGERPVAVLLIPTLDDLRRFATSGPDPLSQRLAAWGAGRVELVNLLPAMAADDRRWRRYFLPCDYHWNARANRVAAALVWSSLRDSFYAPLGAHRGP